MSDTDLLDFNMENISNELHALIREGEEKREAAVEYSPPQLEFHYLSSFNTRNPSVEAVPLISNAVNNPKLESSGTRPHYGYRKFQKPFRRYEKQDYANKLRNPTDSIDIPIGLGTDGKERNLVLRLFGLFHEMHYYMNEVLPCTYAMFSKHNICLMPPVRTSMPTTMNIQYQVKQAARKCIIFICDLERIINANKLYDRIMYAECEQALRNLRKVFSQFEIYKRIELEHKQGQFVSESAIVNAEHLDMIMCNLNECIRYSNFLVNFFDWTMSKKHNKPRIERLLLISLLQQSLIREECSKVVTIEPAGYERADLLFQILREVREEKQLGARGVSKIDNRSDNCQLINSSLESDNADNEREPIRYVG